MENKNNVPDLIKEPVHVDHLQHLHKAVSFVEEVSKKKEAVTIKIPNGVIVTTCPEKWSEHNKVYLRGNAIK